MKKILIIVIVMTAGYVIFKPEFSDIAVVNKALAADAANGAELFGMFCTGCHGSNKEGLYAYNGELDRLTDQLNGLGQSMPDMTGTFSDEEILDIHAYLTAE